MKQPRSLLLALFVLAPVLLGLQQAGQPGSGPPLSELYPGPLANAQFGEVFAGEFTGDLELDAIVMDGTEPKLVVAPEIFDSAVGTGLSASAVAVLPGVVPGKDLLLVADANGLHSLEWDSEQGAWNVTTLFGAASGWAGAVALGVGDLDGEDGLDVVGVSAAGDTMRVAHGAGDGTFVEGASTSLVGPPTSALRLLNWREADDIEGTDEIALASDQGVALFEPDGTLLGSLAIGLPDLRVTVIDDTGSILQRLAIVGTFNGNDYLRLYGLSGTSAYQNLGPIGVVSLASGDVDGDGDSELFLSVNTERELRMLENRSPVVPTFLPASALKYAYGSTQRDPAWSHAGLAVADFDSDGVIDVLAPAQGGSLPLGGGTSTPVYGTVPLVHVGAANPGAYRVAIEEAFFNMESNQLILHFGAPATVLPSAPGAETKLQVSVWRTPDFGQWTIPLAYHSSFEDLPAPTTVFSMSMPVGYSPATSPDVFSFVIRQVSVLDGVIVADAPALSALLVSEANRELVEGSSSTQTFVPMVIYQDSVPPQGGLGGGPTVPPTPDGQTPTR